MNKKKVILFLLWIPVLLIIVYIYFIMNLMWKKSQPKADILGAELNTTGSSSQNISWSMINNVPTTWDIVVNKNDRMTWIKVYIPSFFENNWFKNLKKKLFSSYNIKSDYVKIDNIKEYQDKLLLDLAKWGSDVDVFMVPLDWINTFKSYWYKVEFKKDISPVFNYVFYDYIRDNNYTLIPYSIDPLVTLYADNVFSNDKSLTIDDIKNSILVSDSSVTKKYYFSTLFWLWNYDVSLIKNNKELYNNYFLVLYEIVRYIAHSKDTKLFEFFISLSWEWADKYWDPIKFKKITEKFEEKYKYCSISQPLCMLSRGLWGFYFWFSSDVDIYDRFFASDSKLKQGVNVVNFPMLWDYYPVRGWWFVINKNSKNLEASNMFVNEYMKESLDGKTAFWTNTLSAFNVILDQQKLDLRYQSLSKYFDKFNLIVWDLSLQQRFVQETKIIDVLTGKYSISAFVDNINWEF